MNFALQDELTRRDCLKRLAQSFVFSFQQRVEKTIARRRVHDPQEFDADYTLNGQCLGLLVRGASGSNPGPLRLALSRNKGTASRPTTSCHDR